MQQLFAADTWQGTTVDDVATISSLTPLITNVIKAIVVFSGVVLFVMLLVGGFLFLFSAGDQKKLEKAKGTITGAFTGLLVLVGSYLILLLIEKITGVKVTTFGIQVP